MVKIAAFAVAALLVSAAAVADTNAPIKQTPGSKIVVAACDPHVHTVAQAHPWIDPYGVYHTTMFPACDAFLGITYKNVASVAATEVDFGLVARGSLVAVAKDVGSFAPDVSIDHEFVISREVFPLGTSFPYCAVMRVKYADGSVWNNPNPPEP
jgi:hypothetical protein